MLESSVRRGTLCDRQHTERRPLERTREGLLVGLFFLEGSPVEWRTGDLESGCSPLPLTLGSRLWPHPSHKEREKQRGYITMQSSFSKVSAEL